jgi:hypothetical protein
VQHTCTVAALRFNSNLFTSLAGNKFRVSFGRFIYKSYLEAATSK